MENNNVEINQEEIRAKTIKTFKVTIISIAVIVAIFSLVGFQTNMENKAIAEENGSDWRFQIVGESVTAENNQEQAILNTDY